VTAVFPEVRRDPVGSGCLTHRGRLDRVRLSSASSLPQRGDVVNIDVQPLLLCAHSRRP